MKRLKAWARGLKRDMVASRMAARDPRVPWHAKAVAGATAAYALSSIDLIPDFIPILGYLDDLVIVPAGIWLAIRMITACVMMRFSGYGGSARRSIHEPCRSGINHQYLDRWSRRRDRACHQGALMDHANRH